MPKKSTPAMSAADYLKTLRALSLTPYQAGPVLGVTRRQSYRYAKTGRVTLTIARLLEMMKRHGVPLHWMEK